MTGHFKSVELQTTVAAGLEEKEREGDAAAELTLAWRT